MRVLVLVLVMLLVRHVENPMKNKVFGIIMLKTLLKIRYSEHDDDDDYDGYKNHHFLIFNAIN